MRIKRVAVLLLFCAVVLAACGGQSDDAKSLAYASDADNLVIFADEVTTAGGFIIGQECNHIPRLRIWGDGRTIYSDLHDGKRRILIGQTSPEQINTILTSLDGLKYFSNPPESSMDGSGSGYRIGIKLKSGSHNSFWSTPNEIYQALIDTFNSDALAEYQPTEGYLVIGPKLRKEMYPSPPVWPAEMGFRLSDPNASDRVIRGSELSFLWQAINNQPEPLTGIQDGVEIYAVAVFVEGISLGDPPFKCWNK